jgi:hypothetical protein
LHDIGRVALPGPLHGNVGIGDRLGKPLSEDEKKAAKAEQDAYVIPLNHNHPILSLLILLPESEKDAIFAAAHHNGIFRYSLPDLAKRTNVEDPTQKSILTENIPQEQISSLSRFLRVADVAEAITGIIVDKPMHGALQELWEKSIVAQDTPDWVDPDMLCFMIKSGVFKAYAERMGPDWQTKDKTSKYDLEKVEAISETILTHYKWDKTKQQAVRKAVAEDSLLITNSPSVQAATSADTAVATLQTTPQTLQL